MARPATGTCRGGVFVCGDVESLRDKVSLWLHAMYDDQNLYVLARWRDETPLNNPGQTIADYGFAGDCLQLRFIAAPGTPQERGSHLTCWQGRDGADVMDVEYGKQFNDGGNLKNAKSAGRAQAFADRQGRQGLRARDRHPLEAARQRARPRPARASRSS